MSLRIVIIGAGIGGLAAASLAVDLGHDVTLVERFAEARPVGSGLVIQPVGLAVLDRIGAGDHARAMGAPLARMLGHVAPSGRAVLDVSYRARAPGRAMHRAALFDVLWQAAMRRGISVVTGAQVVAAPLAGGRRRVQLADGREFGPFDLVIDASGSHSVLSPLRGRALRYGAIWGTVDWVTDSPLPQDQLRQRYRGAGQMAGVLPVGLMPGDPRPKAAIFWSLPVADQAGFLACPLADWQAQVAALWPEAAPFFAQITDPAQMTPARYSHGSLARPWAKGMAYIGDAAHRASPQLGQGANMALLDAFALVDALRLGVEDGLPAYAGARRWHVRAYQAMSAAFTPMYQSGSRMLPVVRDWALAPASGLPGVRQVLTALVSGDMLPPVAGRPFP